MRYLNDYSDERLKGLCVHCGAEIDGATKVNNDHVPSKCLLQKPYPDNLPVIKTCFECNRNFSKDEEYLSVFLQCVLVGSTDPEDHHDSRVCKALQRSRKLKERIERSKSNVNVDDGTRIFWVPERERVNNVVLKNASGHAFYEFGEIPTAETVHTEAMPLCALSDVQRRDFERIQTGNLEGWPEVGSRAMERAILGYDTRDGWVIVQDGVYRYQVMQDGGVLVRSVLMEYLATEVYWPDC